MINYKNKLKYLVFTILSIIILCSLLVAVAFILKFAYIVIKNNSLSDWGILGSFYWNTIIALSSFVNVIIFVFLSLKIANSQLLQNNMVLSLQKKQFLHSVITDLRKTLDKCFMTLTFDAVRLESTKQILLSFQSTYAKCYFNDENVRSTINKLVEQIDLIHESKALTSDDLGKYLLLRDKLVLELLETSKAYIPPAIK